MKKTTRTYNRKNKNDKVIPVLNENTEKSSLELPESNLKTNALLDTEEMSGSSLDGVFRKLQTPVDQHSEKDLQESDEKELDESLELSASVLDNITLSKKENNWIVLISTCVNPLNQNYNNIHEIRFRKDLYTYQIKRWLSETNMKIVVVESSGYTFPNIIHDRLTVISFIIDNKYDSSSQYEARSLIYAIEKIKEEDYFKNCTHILKVTGRYFLKNVENVLENSEKDLDLYLQYWRHDENKWQNTEYFGIRRDELVPMLEPIMDIGLIENNLFNYSVDKKYCFIGKFPNNIPRGGDKKLYTEL
jgi:hypothetical protein